MGSNSGATCSLLTSTRQLVLQQHQVDRAGTAGGPVAFHDADVRAAAVVECAWVFVCRREAEVTRLRPLSEGGVVSDGGGLTVLPQVQLVHGVDVAEVGHPGLDLGAALPGGLVDALDHLLLLIDPVQVVPKHSQAHRLQDV